MPAATGISGALSVSLIAIGALVSGSEAGKAAAAASTVAADVSPVQPTVWVTTRPDGVVQRGLALQWAF